MLGDLESVVHKHRPSREQDLVQRSMCFSISAPYFPFIFIYLLREPFSCLFTHPFSAFLFSFHLQDLYSIVIDSFVFCFCTYNYRLYNPFITQPYTYIFVVVASLN